MVGFQALQIQPDPGHGTIVIKLCLFLRNIYDLMRNSVRLFEVDSVSIFLLFITIIISFFYHIIRITIIINHRFHSLYFTIIIIHL